jgi:hypothetical protein
VFVAGGYVLLRAMSMHDMQVTDTTILASGLAAAFVILAGVVAFMSGRILQSIAGRGRRGEITIWRFAAAVACGAGLAAVLYAASSSYHNLPTLNQVALGLAGSFSIMAGVATLLAHRVMEHSMAQRLVQRAPRPVPEAEALRVRAAGL